MKRLYDIAIAALVLTALSAPTAAQTGDAARGERVYRSCVACHSLEPNRNMTGPSLAEVWNRKAGGLPSFPRYSAALKSAGLIWNDATLDEWLKDPQHFIPGNTMTFPGIRNAQQRADLLAFLKDATQPGRAPKAAQGGNAMGGMMGMMGGGAVPNLKTLDPEDRVRSINHCGDTYKVTTADGKIRDFWERNLRFKTDVSGDGPQKGAPAIVPAGMMGDRADVIFASPEEISGFISQAC
ncbi:MAG TPA: cytochrome c family protein [Gemmataceae bacterium]|nr:cytochrome c family protein [Gemmataceae bacterium]